MFLGLCFIMCVFKRLVFYFVGIFKDEIMYKGKILIVIDVL